MPPRPAKPCMYPGCGVLTRDGTSRCEKHKTGGWSRPVICLTTTQRGYGWEWQQLRERILKRDEGLCQVCFKRGKFTLARDVDHIVSKSNGGTDDDSNLQSICLPCHKVKTAEEKVG
jgi:5-methylcytosine-specific restriction protein A